MSPTISSATHSIIEAGLHVLQIYITPGPPIYLPTQLQLPNIMATQLRVGRTLSSVYGSELGLLCYLGAV